MPLPPLNPQLSTSVNLWRLWKGLFSLSVLGALLLICNLIQSLSALLLPLSRRAVRVINRVVGGVWWSASDLFAVWWGIDVVRTGDDPPPKENAFLIANHQNMPDINTLFRLARHKGRIWDLKWFVKDIIKYVPGIGWGMVFLDCIFLKRDWKRDKPRLIKQLQRFEQEQIPIWTISFVEGTRITPRKHEQSVAYAEERGLTPLKHLLLPRTKGFTLTLDALRGHLDAVYDCTIGYAEEGVPTLWQWCRGDVQRVALHVRRFPIAELPEGEEALAEWLKERWREKDALLAHYYQEGCFPQG